MDTSVLCPDVGCHAINDKLTMWTKGNKIHKDIIRDKDFILVKFKCGLCSGHNEYELVGFYADYFIRRPDYVWKTNVECPNCEASQYHDIKVHFKDEHLILDIQCERVSPEWQTEVNQDSVHYSFDQADNVHSWDIPFELDATESIIGNDSYSNYIYSITELREILRVKEITREPVLLKMIYSNIITLFETYLSDLVINIVNSDQDSLRKIVEDYGIFDKEKIEKGEIFKLFGGIKGSVIGELQKISFHNLGDVIPLYKRGLSIDFSGKISGLPEAIEVRHDIVHRNGRDFQGNAHTITIHMINTLMSITGDIVGFVNEEFEKKGIKILKEKKEWEF